MTIDIRKYCDLRNKFAIYGMQLTDEEVRKLYDEENYDDMRRELNAIFERPITRTDRMLATGGGE